MEHTLQVHVTNQCNLNCKYCYIKQNKKKLTLSSLKKQMEGIEVLSSYDNMFNGIYNITYFGGEPLLCLDAVIHFDNWLKSNYNIGFSFMQSNGVLLDEDVKQRLDENNIQLGISCDGKNDLCSKYFAKNVKKGLCYVQPKMIVCKENYMNMMDNVNYFYKLAMENKDENLYIDVSFTKDEDWNSVDIVKLKEELEKLRRFLVFHYTQYNRIVRIGFIERVIQNISKGKRGFVCFAGKNGFSITPSGIVYPCSRFYTNNQYPLYDSMSKKFFEHNFSKVNECNTTAGCEDCVINRYCNRGCLCVQMNQGGVNKGYCTLLKVLYHFCSELYLAFKNKYNKDIV